MKRLLAAFLLLGMPALADALPPRVQAVLFRKILTYDTAAHPGEQARIVVLAGEGANEAASAFRAAGFAVDVASGADAVARVAGAAAVYAAIEAPPAAVRNACAAHHVLSFGGAAVLAERADTAVALGQRADGGPEIVVNLRRLQAEAHQFSAELLKLARVVE